MQVVCPHCRGNLEIPANEAGAATLCRLCGGKFQAPLPSAAPVNMYGQPSAFGPPDPVRDFVNKKIAAGLCGILLGGLGIHKFVLGFNNAGAIMLTVTIVSFVTGSCLIVPLLGMLAMSGIGLAEGIIYLTKSDEEFYQTYAVQKKEWF